MLYGKGAIKKAGKLKRRGEMDSLRRLTEIGMALSRERDVNKLFEMIIEFAMEFTSAEGGTLYVVSADRRTLDFAIVRNRVLGIRLGPAHSTLDWKSVPLFKEDGSPNDSNVSSYCALTGKTVNIPDVYETTGFNFEGTRIFDSRTGYRSKSMLVVPMKNHEDEIIGVLQLINAKDESVGNIVQFSASAQQMAECLASQAAIALTNRMLINELEELFESSIRVITSAIDEKSPYTSGHARRVTYLAMQIAKKINDAKTGPFAKVHFSEDELREIYLASLLHDVGKISIPEHIMDKATKLQCIFDKIELIRMRYELLKTKSHEGKAWTRSELEEEFQFIQRVNTGSETLNDDMLERLKRISQRTLEYGNDVVPIITEEELEKLSVRAGTLTPDEKAIINSHAELTFKMLSKLPFPKRLRNVPFIAASHHEKLDGTGYPRGLRAEDLPLQSRILAIADVFEALTARDRPYKRARTLSEAIAIMDDMAKAGAIDEELFHFFVRSGIPKGYADLELLAEQVDT